MRNRGLWLFMLVALLLGGLVVYSSLSVPARRPLDVRVAEDTAPPELGTEAATLTQASLPHQVGKGGFVSSEGCQECHQAQFESWHDSYHRTMTQVATPETVVAPFTGIQLASRGRVYYLSREGDKFFITMPDPDWEAGALANGMDLKRLNPPSVKREIVMTTGSHHMQGYWVSSKHKNMLRQIPWAYLIEDQRWVPREDIFIEPPDSERHLIVWNENCIVCHAVAGSPNYDLQRMTVSTEVAELGISCEACHGPGAPHIAFHREKKANQGSIDPIVNPANCEPRIAAEICGQCHSYFIPPDYEAFSKQGYTYRAGGDLNASHNLVSYADAKQSGNEVALAVYWNDGTCRVSGREYSALMDSPCYQQGSLTCISCHSMHDSDPVDQLAANMRSDEGCLQCHSSIGSRLEEHTHHAIDSNGSRCYNCHMPYTTYGLLSALRSHRVQEPRIAGREQSDQPNACNLCHLDKTLAWTAEKLTDWYAQPAAELPSEDHETAAALTWLLQGDAVQRSIAAWHMNWPPALEASGSDWQMPFLAQLLDDDYSAVRYQAGKSLQREVGFDEIGYDYVSSPRLRTLAKQRALELWERDRQPTLPADAEQILLDPASGQLLHERLQDLLRRQDKRPIYLPE